MSGDFAFTLPYQLNKSSVTPNAAQLLSLEKMSLLVLFTQIYYRAGKSS